ncbi:hypothetical protein SLEP1_g27932 [Rubroshorea leprosula]|uniref:Uncharacterized protein n=1 Tax=Rubroshorea leprosula TaxID=152421 RepID=A0AAV5K1N3_9ROSI|nr:hypothetical protein SLEP1_g27932 [Rubroshorea leprosula]
MLGVMMNQNRMKVLPDNCAAEIMMLTKEYHGMREKLPKAWHLFPGLDDQECMILILL